MMAPSWAPMAGIMAMAAPTNRQGYDGAARQ